MTQPRKIDYLIGAIAGFVTAFIALFVFMNTDVAKLPVVGLPVAALLVIVPILWIAGLAFGRVLTRWLSFGYQFAKFVVVGFINTAIDFGSLNLISFLTGITSGLIVGGVNVPGFLLAATNSYLWNKFWVFRKDRQPGEKVDYSDIGRFIMVAIGTLLLNSGMVIFLTTFISPLGGMSPDRWLNISKVFATVISLAFNFIGFKLLVFVQKKPAVPNQTV